MTALEMTVIATMMADEVKEFEMGKNDNCAEYIEAIKKMVKITGIQAANDANHKALETGTITLPMFQAAARVLVKEYLKQN